MDAKKPQNNTKNPEFSQYFVSFPGNQPVKDLSGQFAMWHFSKQQLANILKNWETQADWKYWSPSEESKEGEFHRTAIGRPKLSRPIKYYMKTQPKKNGRLLYDGVGRDETGVAGLMSHGFKVDKYDPFHPDESVRQKPKGVYDEVHSHYTLNVVDKNTGKDIIQRIHDSLDPNGRAVISVRRDLKKKEKKSGDPQKTIVKTAPDGQKTKVDPLEKSRPDYEGQKDPEKGYVAVKHKANPKFLIWSHDREKGNYFEKMYQNGKYKFFERLPDHVRDWAIKTIERAAGSPTRHYVTTYNPNTGSHEPKMRHFARLVSNDSTSQIINTSPQEMIWKQKRHGEFDPIDTTYWKITPTGIHDVTENYLKRPKVFLKKSDKTPKDETGIGSQIYKHPEDKNKYLKRINDYKPKATEIENVTPNYEVRTTKDKNHAIHKLGTKAFILLGKNPKNGMWHERAAAGDRHDLGTLRVLVRKHTPQYSKPIAVGAEHMDQIWKDHHPELVEGLVPDKHLGPQINTITPWLSFAGKKGAKNPEVITKEALGTDFFSGEDPRAESYFAHPTFTTAHREAMFHKLANEFFGLGEHVPETTVFNHPLSGRPWSAQKLVPNVSEPHPNMSKYIEDGTLHKMAIMDTVLGNQDRHSGNVLEGDGKKGRQLYLVDNALAFDYGDAIGTAQIPKYTDQLHNVDIPESVHKWLWNLDIQKMVDIMAKHGAPQDIILTAANRLANARGWLQLMKLYDQGKGGQKTDKTVFPLFSYILANKLTSSKEDTVEKQNRLLQMAKMNLKIPPIEPQSGKTEVPKSIPNLGTAVPNSGTAKVLPITQRRAK